MSEWYYMSGGQQHGPVSAAQLKALAAGGTLVPEDLVWNQSMPEWVPARRVRGLPFANAGAAAQAPAVKPVSNAPVRVAARAAAAAAPVAVAPQSEPASQPFIAESPASEHAEVDHKPAKIDHEPRAPRTTVMETAPTRTVDALVRTRTALRLLSFLVFLLMLCAFAAGGFAALKQFDKAKKILTPAIESQGSRLKLPTDLEFMGVAGFYGFMAFILMIGLMRYSSKIKKVRATYGAEELENAVKAQNSIWRFITLITVLTIGLSVVGYMRYVMHVMMW